MRMSKKIEYTKSNITSITRHDDLPVSVREAAAVALINFIKAEMEEAKIREAKLIVDAVSTA